MRVHASWSKLCALGSVVLTALVAGCPSVRSGTRPTPQADFRGDVATVPREQFLSHARNLRYDTSPAASDTLSFPGDPGPFVTLAPEVGAGLVADDVLGTGRVIGRVSSTAALPRLGLGRGYTYYWVDSLGGRWRAVMIPEDAAAEITVLPVSFGVHRYSADAPAHLRFLTDSSSNARCGTRCCIPQMAGRAMVDAWLHPR